MAQQRKGRPGIYFRTHRCWILFLHSLRRPSIHQTGLIWKVNEKLISYGEKIDRFQTAISDMRDDLARQQSQLSSNQTTITNVQAEIQKSQFKISDAQERVAQTQTNLESQQTKLGDVEYWIQNMYEKKTSEEIAGTDTNQVLVYDMTNRTMVVVLLKSLPIRNSVEMSVIGAFNVENKVHGFSYDNLYMFTLEGTVARKDFSLDVTYVLDSRRTNIYTRLPAVGSELNYKDDGTGTWFILNPTGKR